MSASTMWKKLSMAVSAAFLALGTVNAAPASAITFSFQGNLDTDGTPFNGSVIVNDDILTPFIKIFDTDISTFDAEGIFSLKVGATTVSVRGFSLGFVGVYNGGRPAGLGNSFQFLNIQSSSRYSLLIAPFGCSQRRACFGALSDAESPMDYNNFVAYEFPVTVSKSNSKSVPEPTAAIALSLIGASMLIRKRKLSSSPHA